MENVFTDWVDAFDSSQFGNELSSVSGIHEMKDVSID